MTNPNDLDNADFRGTLPADLQALDRELSEIRIEERPSFGPELEGELAEAWRDRAMPGSRASRRWVGTLMAAGLAALLIAGVSVPSARAAVVGFLGDVLTAVFSQEPEPTVQLPEVQVEEPAPPAPEPRTEVVVSPADASHEVVTASPDLPEIHLTETTFPEIIDRQEAADIIASYYPLELQEAGIEGSVTLLFWLDEFGSPQNIQMSEGSGDPRLDRAAMLSARGIRFRPATRGGVGVGTWVEIGVHFFALTGAGIVGSDSMGSGM